MSESTSPEIHKGLNGVVADTTAISRVNPETNSLLYRGYPVPELAAQCSAEQVAYLLWHGELPGASELSAFTEVERAHRSLPDNVRRVIDDIPVAAHPMDVLRTAVSMLGAQAASEADASDDAPDANLGRAMRLFAGIPAIVAYDHRRRHGDDLVEPRDDLDYAQNFLHMTFGEVPNPTVVDAFRVSLILYMEHSFNASTFTARVIASTLSDLYSAITGAIGALKGPLHGGANEAVMMAFDEIDTADRVEEWLDAALADKRKVMGFGHRVYKNGDSRVPTMRASLEELTTLLGRSDVLELYTALETAMADRKNIKPNLDYPSGPVYNLIGFDTGTFTPLFAASRVVGWSAHVMEQLADNALIRPLSAYSGPDERHLER